ncbi:hypothetical protein AVENLUH5627_02698 [Acinetobacter venetianus]|uniref:Zinc-ribbon domain-containing protein n=1 Tax=Acinetobacter venetianus TaxID=52133 RepID=A0A150HLE5_9GAMM|nr:zinc ribbon domain-containing protein [Acinetobacter venetianus]KXZ65968.1 hypothetical protein AVENLUH5627_02698 [Acinetobacter venetianus]
MALINCKECGSQISDKAKTCPQCGFEQPKKTSLFTWIIGGLFAFGVLFAVYGSTRESTTTEIAQPKDENKAGLLLYFAQEQIKQNAKDAASVKFRGEQLHEKTDVGAVACGEVDAKNSFGAYTGFKGFVAIEKDMTLYIENGANSKYFAEKWNKYCVNK